MDTKDTKEPEQEPDADQGQPEQRSTWNEILLSFRWPLVMMVAAVLTYQGYSQGCRAVAEQPGPVAQATEEVTKVAKALGGIAERFKTGKIDTTFTASIPRLVPDGGLKLEVAVVEGTETFRRTDEKRVLFDFVSLGTTETEIRVPATYRYHVRLEDPWHFEVREDDHLCIVKAPRIRASQPPAIHTDRMEKRSTRGWARFNEDEQMAALEKTITPTLRERAEAPEAIDLIREKSRQQVGHFVRNWLLLEQHWRPDRFRSIIVSFEDEQQPEGELPDPTVVLIQPMDG